MVSALAQTSYVAFNSDIYLFSKYLLIAHDMLGAENSAVNKTGFSQNFKSQIIISFI